MRTDVNYSPSGTRLAMADTRGLVHVSDATTDQVRSPDYNFTFVEQPTLPLIVTFGRDDDTVFVGDSTGGVTRWRVGVGGERTTTEKLGELVTADGVRAHAAAVCGSAVSPDRTVLATGGVDRTARLWSTETAKQIGAPLVGHDNSVCGLAFSQDGKVVATASLDHTVRLWDARTGEPLGAPLTGHTGPVQSLAFSSDGLLATGSSDRTTRLWDVTDPRKPTLWATLAGHRGSVNVVAFRPGTRELHTGSDDRTVQVWDLDFDEMRERLCATVREDLADPEFSRLVPSLQPADYRDMCR